MTTQPTIDENKLDEFVGKFAGDLGAVGVRDFSRIPVVGPVTGPPIPRERRR